MKKYILGSIITIVLTVIGFYIVSKFNPHSKRIKFLKEEIPKYNKLTYQDSLVGIISDSFYERGFTYVVLTDSSKIALRPSRNGDYRMNFLGDFIHAGDNLKKKADTDTLLIERNGDKYFFIMGRVINE